MKRSRELAALLLRKAGQDEYVLQKLIPDSDASDETIGFHAQQAVEKAIKAVLACMAVRFPHTHDLLELVSVVRQNGLPFPVDLEDLDRLTPYATGLRYADQTSHFDRQWAAEHVRRVRAWAELILNQS